MGSSREKAFQEDGTADAKVPRWERGWVFEGLKGHSGGLQGMRDRGWGRSEEVRSCGKALVGQEGGSGVFHCEWRSRWGVWGDT